MKKGLRNEQGMALLFATMAIIVIAASMMLVTTRVVSNRMETDVAYNDVLLEEAAQAGIDYAVEALWRDYVTTNSTTRNWASYRYYLDSVLQVPKNEDLNFNGRQDMPHETGDGRNGFEVYPASQDKRGKALIDEPLLLKDPDTQRAFARVDGIYVARYDTAFESYLTIRSVANVEGRKKTAVQVLRIGGAELAHTRFAIMANNISCILCHAEILNIDMEMNTDSDRYDTFDRVMMASLESMLVRQSEADSNIAGTVYTRGDVYRENGTLYSENGLASSTFKGYRISSTDGKIDQASNGSKTKVPLQTASLDSNGDLRQYANLYRNYPTDTHEQTDGPLPNNFPAPFPDDNGNRRVDDAEFDVVFETANGSLDFGGVTSGSMKAGVAYGVPSGSTFNGTNLPTTSNTALSQLTSTGRYDGNLILIGTNDDPIQIDNTVAVDGDLIIQGKVQGEGQLLVRGNVYIAGDVTYADDPGHFGKYDVQANGTHKENAFALVAGGSVMMGDYLTIRGVNSSAQDNASPPIKFPDHTKFSIDVRTKNKSGTADGQTLKYGYNDPYSVDPNQTVSGKPGQQFSFTMSELQLFNNLEVQKALDDSSYIPRVYGLRESQPNNIYVYTNPADEHSVRYSESTVKLLRDYLKVDKGWSTSRVNAFMARAEKQYLNPKSNWISETTLRNAWYADEMSRPSSYRDFKFDGLLYSNNSIFAITRSKTRHQSNTNGRMTIRGGVIAADLGIFVPGPGSAGQRGLNLFYDERVERFLEVRDSAVVTFTRSAFYYLPGEAMPEQS